MEKLKNAWKKMKKKRLIAVILVIVLLMVMNLVSDFFSSVKAIFQLY